MRDITVNLPEALKQLNPELVLFVGDDADTVKNWIKRCKKHKDWWAKVESNIYNEGRIRIVATRPRKGTSCNDHIFFNQAPLTDFVKSNT